MGRSIIVALDYSTREEIRSFLKEFQQESLFVKVGMEAFYQFGPSLVEEIKEQDHQLFLDLKLHDIPNTVKKAMKGLAGLGVDLVNVHAAGGRDMMQSALEGLEAGSPSGKNRAMCIGVTHLTSTSEEMLKQELHINKRMKDAVVSLASLTKASGLDGVVSSALEVPWIKKACGQSFLTVTPGIRLEGDLAQDQKRVATPSKARSLGSDFIVVGRSITAAENPYEAYYKVKKDWEGSYVS
ncbi:orotidine-5'-phosphate decarboxylase [Pseudalkalibacillus caeni]|uniref:Orotidine 5'-phosphate decarboxylase n=1 Tax=Exobacillus caeni TaxID=2574798 RepID=A0A5R9EYX2_9BACL|nr:orotidine-5'-phosphate decarboxylase [Pseudalkalibacillus caeni]TLS35270.1 orotidine-5'-phosphate decarboxylase [Pseudalkalibacillus caeni]